MSYFLADSTGYLVDFASIGGLATFNEWAARQELPFPHLVRDGFVKDFQALRDAAATADVVPAVKEQVDLLVRCSRAAKDILIISDGLGDDEVLRAASAGSPMLRAADKARGRIEATVAIAFASAARRYRVKGEQAALQQLEDTLLRDLPADLMRAYLLGEAAAVIHTTVLRANAISMGFTKEPNLAAQNWAKLYAAELVQGITEETRTRIRNVITTQGMKAEKDIAKVINNPLRAEVIARTESLRAVNEGQLSAWDRAKQNGLLQKDAKKVWITTGDDLLCPICEPMDGVEELLDDPFILDNGEAVMAPPAHPRCRCTQGLAG